MCVLNTKRNKRQHNNKIQVTNSFEFDSWINPDCWVKKWNEKLWHIYSLRISNVFYFLDFWMERRGIVE